MGTLAKPARVQPIEQPQVAQEGRIRHQGTGGAEHGIEANFGTIPWTIPQVTLSRTSASAAVRTRLERDLDGVLDGNEP